MHYMHWSCGKKAVNGEFTITRHAFVTHKNNQMHNTNTAFMHAQWLILCRDSWSWSIKSIYRDLLHTLHSLFSEDHPDVSLRHVIYLPRLWNSILESSSEPNWGVTYLFSSVSSPLKHIRCVNFLVTCMHPDIQISNIYWQYSSTTHTDKLRSLFAYYLPLDNMSPWPLTLLSIWLVCTFTLFAELYKAIYHALIKHIDYIFPCIQIHHTPFGDPIKESAL